MGYVKRRGGRKTPTPSMSQPTSRPTRVKELQSKSDDSQPLIFAPYIPLSLKNAETWDFYEPTDGKVMDIKLNALPPPHLYDKE